MKALEHISYLEYLETDHWRFIRRAAIWAARGRCVLCDSDQELQVHHRQYELLGNEGSESVTVLCKKCHEAYSVGSIEGAV